MNLVKSLKLATRNISVFNSLATTTSINSINMVNKHCHNQFNPTYIKLHKQKNSNQIINSTSHVLLCQCCVFNQQQIRMHSSDQGERQIFYGHKEEPVFAMEIKVDLPKLADGEVLVKVRAATICVSDIHTVTGARIEPTPR